MLHLRGGKIIGLFLTILILGQVDLQGQGAENYNYNGFKNKRFYFGLSLGYRNTNYQLQRSKDFILNDSIAVAESISGNGFSVNAIINMKIGKYFDFRMLPTIAFTNRAFGFTSTNEQESMDRIESVFVEMPLVIRYKSNAYKDKKAFVTAGINYSYDVQSNARLRRDRFTDILRISPHDFAVEFGVGMQFFFPYFIFSPEIKYSHGLENVLIYDGAIARNQVLEKVYSRTFSISFHFEG
jgi:hypothetical protein